MNSFLLLCDVFSFVFLEEIEDSKKSFRNHLTFRVRKICKNSLNSQIISKCLFGVFNFFQKMNKIRRILVKMNSFVRFLEEFTTWQFAFEINWPLGKKVRFSETDSLFSFLGQASLLRQHFIHSPSQFCLDYLYIGYLILTCLLLPRFGNKFWSFPSLHT